MPTKHEVLSHITEGDACAQISLSRVGCLVDASDTYLVALRAQVLQWASSLSAEIALRDQQRAKTWSCDLLDLSFDNDEMEESDGLSLDPGRERFTSD
jgi:hypothetical protein